MKKNNSNHSSSQDGVCGCANIWRPNTWQRKELVDVNSPIVITTPSTLLPYSMSETVPLGLLSPKATDLPKETCFFWYHGQCRRGLQCQFEHETRITWPIVSPLGYVHYEACSLLYCPLRSDLVTFQQIHMKPEVQQLGGQIDGTMMSRATAHRSESSDTSSDSGAASDLNDDDGGLQVTLADTMGRAPSQSNCDASSSGSEEVGIEVGMNERLEMSNDGYATHTTTNMLTLTVSEHFESPPSISSPFSLSKAEGKENENDGAKPRRQQTSAGVSTKAMTRPAQRVNIINCHDSAQHDYRQPVQHSETRFDSHLHCFSSTQHKRQRTSSPETTISARSKKRVKQQTTSSLEKNSLEPDLPCADSYDIPVKEDNSSPPKGPRSFMNNPTQICFYWYHKGFCQPKRRNGKPGECKYVHTIDTPLQQVSKPPNVRNHGSCDLPLCPLRAISTVTHESGREDTGLHDHTLNTGMDLIKDEPGTPPKFGQPFDDQYSSSPRDGIRDAFSIMHAQGRGLRRRTGASRLPKLTGAARERFKIQKERIEKWQTEEHVELNEAMTNRGKKRCKEEKRPQPEMEDADVPNSNVPQGSAEKDCGYIRLCSGRFIRLVEGDTPGEEIVQMFGPTAEPIPETLRSTPGFLKSLEVPSIQNEKEKKLSRSDDMASIIECFKGPEKPCSLMRIGSHKEHEDKKPRDEEDLMATSQDHDLTARTYKVLVDYELPEGNARLAWDTDYVRRLFGEIA